MHLGNSISCALRQLYEVQATVALVWRCIPPIYPLQVHSGFFSDDAGMHDYHHEAFNYNYGVSGVLDQLHGTYRNPHNAPAKSE